MGASSPTLWDDAHADVIALADDAERTRAVETIGKPPDLTGRALVDALGPWSRWHDAVCSLAESSRSPDAFQAALDRWARDAADDVRVASTIYQPRLHADMAGQLFVRLVEVPESVPRVAALADEPPLAFTNLEFEEAIRFFLSKRIATPEEFAALSDAAKANAFTATRLASEELRLRARAILARIIEDGGTLDDFARALRTQEESLGVEASSSGYLETVMRTNVQGAYGAGRFRQLRDPAVVAARPYVQYRTASDNRVRPTHAELDRATFRQDDPEWPRYAPPNGFNCFPAGTIVQGSFELGFRAEYAGQIIEIRTQAGRRLAVTPNHPIATPRGFVAACRLKEGDELIAYVLADERQEPLPVGAPNEEQPPTAIEDVFAALQEAGTRRRARAVGHDFDGDADAFASDVDVVGAEWHLLREADVDSSRNGEHVGLVHADPVVAAARGESYSSGEVSLGAAHGIPRAGALSLDGGAIESEPRPLHTLRFGAASRLNATAQQDPADRVARGAEIIGELLLRNPGEIMLDQVVGINVGARSCHVYDLQSPYGWIVADGILTSNCRCAVVTLRESQVDRAYLRNAASLDVKPDDGFDAAPTGLDDHL